MSNTVTQPFEPLQTELGAVPSHWVVDLSEEQLPTAFSITITITSCTCTYHEVDPGTNTRSEPRLD